MPNRIIHHNKKAPTGAFFVLFQGVVISAKIKNKLNLEFFIV